jgi:hypothetical protein
MKSILIAFFLFFSTLSIAQIDCDYSAEVTDILGTYKTTKDYLVSEKIFAGNSNYVFFSLVKTDDFPTLNVQFINRSMDFIKTNCFDKNSKIYFQLNNGKIITMIHIDEENCGTMVRDPKGFNNRITTGYFMFMKDSFEELKKSPISFMRVKYTTETVDYVFTSELISEMDSKTYNPDTYFMNYLKCIE